MASFYHQGSQCCWVSSTECPDMNRLMTSCYLLNSADHLQVTAGGNGSLLVRSWSVMQDLARTWWKFIEINLYPSSILLLYSIHMVSSLKDKKIQPALKEEKNSKASCGSTHPEPNFHSCQPHATIPHYSTSANTSSHLHFPPLIFFLILIHIAMQPPNNKLIWGVILGELITGIFVSDC